MLPLPRYPHLARPGARPYSVARRRTRPACSCWDLPCFTALWSLSDSRPRRSLSASPVCCWPGVLPPAPTPGGGVALTLVLLWSLALTLHLVPGFGNLRVLDKAGLALLASVPFTSTSIWTSR